MTHPLGCHRAKAHHRHSQPYPGSAAIPGSLSLDSLKGQTHLGGQVTGVGYKSGFFILGAKMLEVPFMSNSANASQLQDRLTTGQGQAHHLMVVAPQDNIFKKGGENLVQHS